MFFYFSRNMLHYIYIMTQHKAELWQTALTLQNVHYDNLVDPVFGGFFD